MKPSQEESLYQRKVAALEAKAKRLESRVKTLETVVMAWTMGRVEIQGVLHLMECDKRNDKKNACNCGAIPVGSDSRKGKG
jgi:hypothetical protein